MIRIIPKRPEDVRVCELAEKVINGLIEARPIDIFTMFGVLKIMAARHRAVCELMGIR